MVAQSNSVVQSVLDLHRGHLEAEVSRGVNVTDDVAAQVVCQVVYRIRDILRSKLFSHQGLLYRTRPYRRRHQTASSHPGGGTPAGIYSDHHCTAHHRVEGSRMRHLGVLPQVSAHIRNSLVIAVIMSVAVIMTMIMSVSSIAIVSRQHRGMYRGNHLIFRQRSGEGPLEEVFRRESPRPVRPLDFNGRVQSGQNSAPI